MLEEKDEKLYSFRSDKAAYTSSACFTGLPVWPGDEISGRMIIKWTVVLVGLSRDGPVSAVREGCGLDER
jgi:hypothetical protein